VPVLRGVKMFAGVNSARQQHSMIRPLSIFALMASCALVATTGCMTNMVKPLKRGQTSVDPSRLPFVCLVIGTPGFGIPVKEVILENCTNHQEFVCALDVSRAYEKTEYPTAKDQRDRMLSLFVWQLSPGTYRVKQITLGRFFGAYGGTNFTIPLPTERPIRFVVAPAAVNYVGTLILDAKWGTALTMGEGNFRTEFEMEASAARDQQWAHDTIPGLRNLPAISSVLGP
jgi:hypothetical protein